jgi:hypothetical protein
MARVELPSPSSGANRRPKRSDWRWTCGCLHPLMSASMRHFGTSCSDCDRLRAGGHPVCSGPQGIGFVLLRSREMQMVTVAAWRQYRLGNMRVVLRREETEWTATSDRVAFIHCFPRRSKLPVVVLGVGIFSVPQASCTRTEIVFPASTAGRKSSPPYKLFLLSLCSAASVHVVPPACSALALR